jgi:SagB-type dehydrogenase family enzyme
MPPGEADACWELFHENSKLSRFDVVPELSAVREEMERLHESLPYDEYPSIELPTRLHALSMSLGDAICDRRSVRSFIPTTLDLTTLATILYYSYGRTESNNEMPRAFRAIPSGGALYPLELYFYSASLQGIPPGFFHYDPARHCITLLQASDSPLCMASTVVQPDIVTQAAMIVFVTALFARSTFKYGDRGYRFTLLEAGHFAQNLLLVLQGLGLAGVSIGGFFDREVDKLLQLDGVNHSSLYMIALGKAGRDPV